MKYSVIIPVYNAEKYIRKCIGSVISDSREDLEVVAVDDGSSDQSLEILNEVSKSDPRVKVLSKENGGVSSARNLGIEKANGEWITFLDADDFYTMSPFSAFDEITDEHSCDVIRFSCKSSLFVDLTEHRKDILLATLHILGEENWYYDNHLASACYALYKSEIIRKNSLRFDEKLVMGEDMFFNLEYNNCSSTMYFSAFDFYNYTDNSKSATKKLNTRIPEADHLFQNKLLRFLNKNAYSESTEIYRKSVLQGILVCCNTCFHRYGFSEYAKARNSFIDFVNREPYCSALVHMNCDGFNMYKKLVLYGAKYHMFFPGYLLRKAAVKFLNKS